MNQREDPLGNSDYVNTFNYDNDILKTTSRQGEVNNYTYDADNRFLSASYADGSTTQSTITPATLFDQANRFTNLTDSLGGAISRTYDGLDDMLTETTPQGTITYTYDLDGRRTSMSVPGQAEITYGYDADSRLACIAQGTGYSCTGTSLTPTVAITYDADSRRSTQLTLPNGIVGTYSYDAASELTGLTYKEGSTTVGALTYGYDAAGRIISRGGSLYEAISADGDHQHDLQRRQPVDESQWQHPDLRPQRQYVGQRCRHAWVGQPEALEVGLGGIKLRL
jgi:YD repeat-containing protein